LNDTQTLSPTVPSPRRLSDTTRVVGGALDRVTRCRCGDTPSVVVVRAFDGASRRPARGRLEVDTPGAATDAHLWASATVVEVRQLDGLHLLYRDEVLVDDAPERVRVEQDSRGVARRVR
jgi:hypothetical protein